MYLLKRWTILYGLLTSRLYGIISEILPTKGGGENGRKYVKNHAEIYH